MRAALLPVCTALALAAPVVRAESIDAVRGAIAQAVAERFHIASTQVAVAELRVDATLSQAGEAGSVVEGALVAVPDPGARTAQPAQFTLRAGSRPGFWQQMTRRSASFVPTRARARRAWGRRSCQRQRKGITLLLGSGDCPPWLVQRGDMSSAFRSS